MNIEVMIYVYMAVCTAMILFNCVMVLVNGNKTRITGRSSRRIRKRMGGQICLIQEGRPVESGHLHWMQRHLLRLRNLNAFDTELEAMQEAQPDETAVYLKAIRPVFLSLAGRYCGRDTLEATYFAYVVRKYHIARHGSFDSLTEAMLGLLSSPSVYARENALHIIYDLGDADCAVRALLILDQSHTFHHPKLIHDGLLDFAADRGKLLAVLWKEFEYFSPEMQTTLVNYMRLSGGGCDKQIFTLMTSPGLDDEVYFACMRYFGRFFYKRAYPLLLENLRTGENRRWELAAVAASVLRNYPGVRTVDLLKEALHSSVWYIRSNAAESLEALGVGYTELAAIFEGEDRYAREILQYRLDYRRAKEKEAVSV